MNWDELDERELKRAFERLEEAKRDMRILAILWLIIILYVTVAAVVVMLA